MAKVYSNLETRLIHSGEPRKDGAVAIPIFQTVMFEFADASSYHSLRYIRVNNTPRQDVLHKSQK